MVNLLAVSGYRSLRNLMVALGQITVISGPNGTGKSSIYRALRNKPVHLASALGFNRRGGR